MIDPVMVSMIAVIAALSLFSICQNMLILKISTKEFQRLTARLIIVSCTLILLLVGQIAVYEFEGQHDKTLVICSRVLMIKEVVK